jgi:hypothetical protein
MVDLRRCRLGVDLVQTNTPNLESTLTMLKHKLETGIEVVRDYDRSLPELPASFTRPLGRAAWSWLLTSTISIGRRRLVAGGGAV